MHAVHKTQLCVLETTPRNSRTALSCFLAKIGKIIFPHFYEISDFIYRIKKVSRHLVKKTPSTTPRDIAILHNHFPYHDEKIQNVHDFKFWPIEIGTDSASFEMLFSFNAVR